MKSLIQLLAFLCMASSLHAQVEAAEEYIYIPTNPFFQDEYVVQATSLNLREKPDRNSKAIENLPRGTVVKFLEAWEKGRFVQLDTLYGQWYKVRSPKGKEGYVYSHYLAGTYELRVEDAWTEGLTQGLEWYGVYMRDSFADELRRVQLRVAPVVDNDPNSLPYPTLKTDQKQVSKFLLGTRTPLKPGFCGSLGAYDLGVTAYFDGKLTPGSLLITYAGNEIGDTTSRPSWFLAATGCGRLTDTAMVVDDYRLYVMDNYPQPTVKQELTDFVKAQAGTVPAVSIVWYGDLDYDGRPDIVLDDCPEEMGCRYSLYLSSKARKGELLRKVCEYYLPME